VPSENADRVDFIVACVESRTHGVREELKQFLLQKLPGWQVPREWWFVESLTGNGHSKWSRAEWRQSYLENRGKELFR
jgi:acyl-CoA synthetase (AMP-forming)/AMP-acid ligase II